MNTKYPLLWSALSLALGVVLYDTFPSFFMRYPWVFPLAAGCFLLLSFLFRRGKGLLLMVLFLCILTAGMGRMFLADRYYEQQSSSYSMCRA